MTDKKEKEKIVLRYIYNEKNEDKYELIDNNSEQPDFIIKDLNTGGLFGVEVTDMYYDRFSAMLKEKPGVIADMLKKGIYRNAIGVLNKHQLYIELNNSWHYIGETIGEKFKKYDDYIDALVKTIEEKNEKEKNYNKNLKYNELFINDKENYLAFKNTKQLACLENSEKLLKAINNSPFKRIYFFTIVDKNNMLLLVGDTSTGPLAISEQDMKKTSKIYE